MSAMHWEARRRQMAVDRRASVRAKQQEQSQDQSVQGVGQEEGHLQAPAELPVPTAPPQTAVTQTCPLCKCQLTNKHLHGAKIENRFSSKQYSQQW